MLSLQGFLFFFLWLITIIYCNESVLNKVKVHSNKQISIYDLHYNILSNPEIQDRKHEISMDKVNALVLISSCSAAEWTIFYLCDFVLKFPLFYSRKFLNTDYKNELIYNRKFLVTMLTEITKFIILLVNVMEDTSISLHHKDNSLFIALVLLQIKIEIILLTKNDAPESNDSDVIVIREMLEEMNAIQIFLSLNCDSITPRAAKYISQMYGYTITEPATAFILLNVFHLNTYVSCNHCNFTRTFLQRYVGMLPKDPPFSRDIGNSKSNIYNEKGMVMQIKDVFKQIQLSYDINMIYWYMKSIFGAIIKLLYNTLMEGMQKMYLTIDNTDTIRYIINVIKGNRKNFPIELLQEFEHFKYAKNRNDFSKNDDYIYRMYVLYKQYTNYNYIQLGKYQLTMEDVLDASQKQGDYNETEMEEFEFQNYLKSFLKTIYDHISDFICFNRYFRYFENEFNKNFLPYNIFKLPNNSNNSPNKIKNDKKKKSNDDVGNCNGCYFIIDMYYMCYSSVMFLNRSINQTREKEKSKIRKLFTKEQNKNPNLINYNLIKAKTIIYDIKNYFINFIKTKGNNLELHQIGNDIVTVLVNLPEFSENSLSLERKHVKYLKRIINYIMAKLNSWGLVYCPYPKFPFLLFSYANINKFKGNYTQKMYEKQQIEPKHYQCFNYKYLYNTFITNETQSKTLKKYEKLIKL